MPTASAPEDCNRKLRRVDWLLMTNSFVLETTAAAAVAANDSLSRANGSSGPPVPTARR